MGIASSIKNSDRSVKKAFQMIEKKLGHTDYSLLSASRLVGTDSSQRLVSISSLSSYVSGTANQITITDVGDGTLTISIPSAAVITFANDGLHILDTNASHDLILKPGSDLTADRTLTLTTGDANRTLTLNGNATLNDWFDQAVKSTSDVTFNDITVSTPSNIYTLSHDSFADFVAGEHFLQSAIVEVGTIATGVWEATDVGVAHGGTGASTVAGARTNLGLGTADSVVFANVTSSALTQNRVVLAGASGILSDSANLTFATNVLAVNGSCKFGDGGTTDYMEFETDGTLKMNGAATVWNDSNFGGLTLDGPVATRPSITTLTDNLGADTGIATRGFDVAEKGGAILEVPHSYKEGSDLVFHVHWQGDTAPTGTDNVKWQLTYTVSQEGATLPPVTTTTVETGYDTQYERVTSSITISDATINMGDQFAFILERIAASADEYGSIAKIFTVGLHVESDTLGSRQITTK